MPRYNYRCTVCKTTQTIHHLSHETVTACEKCKSTDSMKKLLSRFTTTPKKTGVSKAGTITEDFIVDAREELLQQKREMREDT